MFHKTKLFCVVIGFVTVSSAVQASGPLKIGIIESISGPAAAYGDMHRKGTRLAIEEINSAGGFNGQPLVVVAEDDRSDPAAGINAAKKLIAQQKVSAVVGSPASLVSIAFTKENERYKVPAVNGIAGSPAVTTQGYKYSWRVNMTDSQLDSKAVEHFINEKNTQRIAFLVENSDYGKPPTEAAANLGRELGATITAYEEYNRGETDFKAQLTKIKDTSPELVFVHGYYTEGSIIARQLRELGIDAQLIINMGQGVPKFVELAGNAAEGAVFPTTWLPGLDNEKSKHFEAAYKAKYNEEPGAFDAGAYDAIYTIYEAAQRGGGSEPKQVQEGLGKLAGFEMLLGPLNFDETNQNNGEVRLATFVDGQIVPFK